MIDSRTLAARFCEADRDGRRHEMMQYFVIKTVLTDPLRAVEVYRILLRNSGERAAETFYRLLEQAKTRSLFYLWYWHVAMTRRSPCWP